MSNADIIKDHYAASDRGDMDGMLAPLAPDVSWTEAAGFPYAGTYVGPQAVLENVFARIQADWEGFQLVIEDVIDGGDTVVGLGTYSGTHRVTGRPFSARVAHVWNLADGKVVRFEQVVDSELVNAAAQDR
ncbi:nuclear transport factor 2 family protein [Demequina zhanjiangensis]|uniref:Nuclear transport factor 2 family protein n=1 Tax=Demequina zhanjiangensis TaxID=3051659 RepID=A0ABT8G4D1_9MICO|nr:nuclear transport factor 2 family protein [Demequina sp. SYSU T00b26]MDN4474001.1 nuclear transport factor 2 family protein [Demequina sp. SYSU T00b26]